MIRMLLAFLLLPFSVIAQDKLDKTKSAVKKELDNYAAGNEKSSVTQTDSTLTLYIIDPKAGLIEKRFAFDKKGNCSMETTKAGCDSCIKFLLRQLLDQKSYEWKKINENQYVSRFADKILLELPVEADDYSFHVFRAQWTKELYDLLLKQK